MLPTLRTVRHVSPMARPAVRMNMDRWFDEFLGRQVTALPETDLYETENEFVVELDLPGFDTEHVDVTVEQGVLTVTGERRLAEDREDATYHVKERSWGRFVRRFRVPAMIDASAVAASADQGVLRVVLPKASEAKARKVEIDAS